MSTEVPPRFASANLNVNEEINPYAPPGAAIDEGPVDLVPIGDLAAAEAIRRQHISHEAAVKSIGTLHFLGAFFGFLAAVSIMVAALFTSPVGDTAKQVALFGTGGFYLLLSGLHLALGLGLTRLQTWARWTDIVLISLMLVIYAVVSLFALVVGGNYAVLIGYGIGALIPGYMLYLLASSKASTIFAPEYKTIIDQTPHIKRQTSLLLKILVVVLVLVIVLAIVGGIAMSTR